MTKVVSLLTWVSISEIASRYSSAVGSSESSRMSMLDCITARGVFNSWAAAMENRFSLSNAIRIRSIICKQLTTVSLYTNQALLERALYNLLDNAAKYSPQGSTIAVQLLQEGNSCVFKVADEGCGISPEAVAHIFEPFYREDPSRYRGIAGAGLGLSFVKEFADAYGGSISCTSAVHVGTEFTLILPQNPEK